MTTATRFVPQTARNCSLCVRPISRSDLRWSKDGFDIVECAGCRLVQRLTLPTSAELEAIYSDDYFRQAPGDSSGQGYLDYVADAAEHRLNADRRLARLERLSGPGRLLDVGAAAGFFVEAASRRGWDVVGIDIAPSMTKHAREALHQDVRTANLRTADVAGPFDVVTMWDYIEHTCDPVGDVTRAAALLRPGGLLLLSTGDVASLTARVSGARWHLLTPRHHNFFFSVATIRALLERAGLVITASDHPAARYSTRYLVHKLRTMLPSTARVDRALGAVLHSRAAGVAVPMNLFDVMTVVTQKARAEVRH